MAARSTVNVFWLESLFIVGHARYVAASDSSARDAVRSAFSRIAASIGVDGTADVFGHRGSFGHVFIEVKRDPERLEVERAAWFRRGAAFTGLVPNARFERR